MTECHDIYVRAYAVPTKNAPENDKRRYHQDKWADCALIVDCETRVTADQTLTFGFARFCELRGGRYVPVSEGTFHDDKVGAREVNLLRRYVRHSKPDTTADGCDRLYLFSRSNFVKEVLGIAIQANAFIVCFNSGFDLSRFAVDWETAANGGWSLILSQWRDPKTRKNVPNKFFPRIVIKALNSKTAIIHSTRAPMAEPKGEDEKAALWPPARFVDLRTSLWALRNRSYSLGSACRDFKTEHQKIDHTPTGKVRLEEIHYARNDVACTVDLLNAVKREFDLHPIAPGLDRMFSPASVAKSYLEELNVLHPLEKVNRANKETIK